MPMMAVAFPILPGKTAEWRAWMDEINGPRRDEFDASRKAAGVRERTFLQETPMGDLVLVTLEGDDPAHAFGKMMNAGQICLAPDYVMVPESKSRDFVAAAESAVTKMFPTLKDNPDYTSVINQRHYDRLQSYIADAREKGASFTPGPAGTMLAAPVARSIFCSVSSSILTSTH